jgi:RNA polymerase sigma factor (sigma-70 family)
MQDAFLKVWERWDRVVAMERPVGYLYRAAMNLFRSRYRRAATFTRLSARRREPRDELSSLEDRDQIVRGLAGLTPRQRAAVVLTELLDFDAAEAAEMLGVKPVTIRSLAHDGRETLKKTLERDHD